MRILIEPDFSAVKIVGACDIGWYIIFGGFLLVALFGAVGEIYSIWQKFNIIKRYGVKYKQFYDKNTDYTKYVSFNILIDIIILICAIFFIYLIFRDVFCYCLC